ncbi:MAG: ABC transporter substrate-binding protein, partial [Cyanobacteria bacterium J06559_3]
GEAGRNGGQYDVLSQIAPTLLWPSRQNPGQWRETLRSIAAALDRDAKAEAVIEQYETRMSDMRTQLAEVVTLHPTLLLLAANRLEAGVRIVEPNSYLGSLLEAIGFQLVSSPAADNAALTSVEVLPDLNKADSIVVLGFNLDVGAIEETPEPSANKSISDWFEAQQVQTVKQNWETNAIAQSLTASKEDRVYFTTFYKWNGLNGPIGAELILEELRQFFLD